MSTATKESKKTVAIGNIIQVIGVVVDIEFEKNNLPAIYNALEATI